MARQQIEGAIRTIAYWSSLSWVLAVFFGISLRYAFPENDPYTIVQTANAALANQGVLIGSVLLFLLYASISAIAYSTLDSLISATSFTVTNDILLPRSSRWRKLSWARAGTILTVLLQFIFYLHVRRYAEGKIDEILYLCWSLQIGLIAPVISALFDWKDRGITIFLAIAVGAAGAATPFFFDQYAVYEYSPLAALLGSFVGLGVGRMVFGRGIAER